jgi:hypothetical protein
MRQLPVIPQSIWLLIFVVLFSNLASAMNVNMHGACRQGQNLFVQTRDGFKVSYVRYGFEDAELWEKLIVIVPPTGGVNQIDRTYAKMFCENGYLALIIKGYTGSDEVSLDLNVHQRVIGSSVRAFRILRARYNQKFFGILGTSAGGIVSSTLVDDFADDLDAIFTIVSGAPLASVIARAGERGLKNLREARMRRFGYKTVRDYEMALAKTLEVDIPVNISPNIKVGMILAGKDSTVPTLFQNILKSWWKPHWVMVIEKGHTPAIIISAAQHRLRILKFFNSAVSDSL